MRKTRFYIDGYNIYHGIKETGDKTLLWLNLFALAYWLMKPDEILDKIVYFTSLPTKNNDSYRRHINYLRLITNLNTDNLLDIVYGRQDISEKACRRDQCQGRNARFIEEKELDVAIASHIVRDTLKNQVDSLYLISADSDMNPAIRMIENENVDIRITICAPPLRPNKIVNLPGIDYVQLSEKDIAHCRAPVTIVFNHRKTIVMPETWVQQSTKSPIGPAQGRKCVMNRNKIGYSPP